MTNMINTKLNLIQMIMTNMIKIKINQVQMTMTTGSR